MTETIRVLLPLDSRDEETFRLALADAQRMAEAAGAADVVLLTHTRRQLDITGLSRFLGSEASKALAKGQAARLPWGGQMRNETLKTFRHQARGSVVIAYYANEELLDLADTRHGIAGIVAVPWVPGEADDRRSDGAPASMDGKNVRRPC